MFGVFPVKMKSIQSTHGDLDYEKRVLGHLTEIKTSQTHKGQKVKVTEGWNPKEIRSDPGERGYALAF